MNNPTKKSIGPGTYLYPMPAVIIGANVDGKPNYLVVAWCGIIHDGPPMLAICLGKSHYTNAGIKQNGTFSVNIPSSSMAEVTDYVGTYSGNKVDKSEVFDVFYGKLETAPMISECPMSLECKLVQTIDYGSSEEIFIGEIVDCFVDEDCLTDGEPDTDKLDPITFTMGDLVYRKLGEPIGKAWNIGKNYKS